MAKAERWLVAEDGLQYEGFLILVAVSVGQYVAMVHFDYDVAAGKAVHLLRCLDNFHCVSVSSNLATNFNVSLSGGLLKYLKILDADLQNVLKLEVGVQIETFDFHLLTKHDEKHLILVL